MALTIVADMEESRMEKSVLKLIDRYFSGSAVQECGAGCPDSSGNTYPCSEQATPKAFPFQKTINKRNHQANCIIGGFAPSLYQEEERLATVLLCNILGGPASNSILNSILRERNGWVYGVECSYSQFSDTGMVTISLGCDKGNIDRCIETIHKEIGRLQQEPLSERKLKAAKKQLLGQLAISGDNGETQCLSMGKGLLAYGKITGGKETRRLVETITAEQVCNAARIIFDKEKLSTLIYV